MKRIHQVYERCRWLLTICCTLALAGCSPQEIRGSYDVQIEIAGIAAPLDGALILIAGVLDAPPLAEDERAMLSDWFASDTLDADSCFILDSPSTAEDATNIVRVFETRLRGAEIVLPIEIYRTPSQRIEIVDLKFFANTIGGEIVLHDGKQQREGRLSGIRSGPPSAQQCLLALESFRSDLRASLMN